MVECKRQAVEGAGAPSAKRPSKGSGRLAEDLEAEIDIEQDLAEEDVDAMMFDDGIELELGEAGRNWERPEPKPHNPKKDKLGGTHSSAHATEIWLLVPLLMSSPLMEVNFTAVFQQMEVDYIIGRPNKDVHVTDLTDVPIIRMYGVTESGIGTCCEGMHRPH